MAYELVYTSAPEGLNRGSSGFCVVACTKGIGSRLVVTLEGISAYKPLYPHYAPNAWDNPVSRSHYIYTANGEQQHILSRICFNGVDHTQRSNKLASHLVLSQQETAIAKGGPLSLLQHDELFKDASWNIQAGYFPMQKQIPETTSQIQKCSTWESVMGDAGWAGYLAGTYIDSPNRNVYIAYLPEQSKLILPLLREAADLLPEELRWKLTFNTYFVNLPVGMNCTWRCCPIDSDIMKMAHCSPQNIILDITKPAVLNMEDELISAARTGQMIREKEIESVPDKMDCMQSNVYSAAPTFDVPKLKLKTSVANVKIPPNTRVKKNVRKVEEEGPSIKKAILLIAGILCLLGIVVSGVFYYALVKKDEQLFVVKSKEFEDLLQEYRIIQKSYTTMQNGIFAAAAEKDWTAAVHDVKKLQKSLAEIMESAEELLQFQGKFKEHSQGDSAEKDSLEPEDPDALLEQCHTLEKKLSSLQKKLEKEKKAFLAKQELMRKKAEKKEAEEKARMEEEKKKKEKNKEKKIEKKAEGQNPEKEQTVPETVKETAKALSPEELQYFWIHAKKLQNLQEGEKFKVALGNVSSDTVKIRIFPGNEKYPVGKTIQMIGADFRQAEIKTEIKGGEMIFLSVSKYQIPKDNGILICYGDNRHLPLFFQLGLSKLKPAQKKADNLQWLEGKGKIQIALSALEGGIPTAYYDEKYQKQTPAYRLELPDGKKVSISLEMNKYFISECFCPGVFHKKQKLAQIEKELTGEKLTELLQDVQSDQFGKMIEEYQKKKKEQKELQDQIQKLQKEFQDQIQKLQKQIQEAPQKKKESLKANLEGTMKWERDSLGKAEQMLKNLLAEIQKEHEELLNKIPLEKFGFSGHTKTLSQEKKEIAEEFAKETTAFKKDLNNATFQIFFGGKAYDQFSIKEILP